MERIQLIIAHNSYKEYLKRISDWEKERIFCHHDPNHFLNVARIAWILNLEEAYECDRELVYAAALLHDIGRFKQYEDGTDHALYSAELAPQILRDCGYNMLEVEQIVSAIATHRKSEIKQEKTLGGLLYRADKLSRDCYFCQAEQQCNWKQDKKNQKLMI